MTDMIDRQGTLVLYVRQDEGSSLALFWSAHNSIDGALKEFTDKKWHDTKIIGVLANWKVKELHKGHAFIPVATEEVTITTFVFPEGGVYYNG